MPSDGNPRAFLYESNFHLDGLRPPPRLVVPPLLPATEARSRLVAKARFSAGTDAPPRRATSLRRSGSIPANPLRDDFGPSTLVTLVITQLRTLKDNYAVIGVCELYATHTTLSSLELGFVFMGICYYLYRCTKMEGAVKIETLETDGFVCVEYPTSLRFLVIEANDSWEDFCGLPMETKRMLSGGDRIQDFGYMLRDDGGPKSDRKEQFHVLRSVVDELRAKADNIEDRRASAFIDAIDSLLYESAPLIQSFAQRVQDRYGLIGFVDEVMESQDNWTFRYLHYFGGEMLAHPHVDRGGFTLHLHESDEGGEYLSFDKEWLPWPVSETQTIIFPGMGLQYRSGGELKALCHQVRPTSQTALQGRYAMVAFIDFAQTHRYDHKGPRLQEFEPGFNYHMPHEEFQRFFVRR